MSKLRADLYTREWQRIRLIVLERDGWRCQRCGKHLTPGNMSATVDHIRPHRLGGGMELENLRAMCNWCNASRGARMKRGHRGWLPRARTSRFG